MSATTIAGAAGAVVTVLTMFYVVSELQQGNSEPLANMLTKAVLVGTFGVVVGGLLYGFVRFFSDA